MPIVQQSPRLAPVGKNLEDASGRMVIVVRALLRTLGRRAATLFTNANVRYLLWPSEGIESPKGFVVMERNSYFNGGPKIHAYNNDDGVVHVGKYCSIANDVEFFLGGNHHPEWISTYPHHSNEHEVTSRGNIEIGHNVWIGRGAVIMSGVRIGDGAVVGAKALVTSDVRPYAIVGGVPAKEIRRRFDDATVDRLCEISWWDWPDEIVEQNGHILQGTDIDLFFMLAESVIASSRSSGTFGSADGRDQ
jgi:acetyltransferase-like isoleucine patch superfamily enzyme